MNYIIYPTLDLFIYDLREGLGENYVKINENKNNFFKKIAIDLDSSDFADSEVTLFESFKERDEEYESEYIEMLNKKRIWFQSNSGKYPLKGYYYPVRLNDTYSLLLDCSVENELNTSAKTKRTPYPVDSFTTLKDYINQRRDQQAAIIGETWMLSGELPSHCTVKPEDIAQECYQTLIPGVNWEKNLQGQGQLLGGTIFELWGQPSTVPSSPVNPLDKHHIIIALYPDEEAARKASRLNYSWLRLFWYRSKVLWAYAQSRELKQKLKADIVPIYEGIQNIQSTSSKKQKLTQLRPILDEAQQILSRYSLNLSDFEYQVRTLEINLYNYQKRLEYMQEESESYSSQLRHELGGYLLRASDLKFLGKFNEIAADKYLLQLKKDYENLTPGGKLLEGLINSITAVRSIIEIDQAERDRHFQETVAIFGVGLGFGSAVASISSHFPTVMSPSTETIKALKQNIVAFALSNYLHVPDRWLAPGISVILSLTAAIAAGLVTKTWIWLRRRR